MDDINFDYIWKKYIINSVNCFLDSLSEEQKLKYGVKTRDEKTLKKQIYKEYEIQRTIIKKRYHNGGAESSGRIDHHKIAACVCCSLIKHKIIEFKITKDLPTNILLANYTIAFNSSIGIIFAFLISDYFTEKKESEFQILKENKTLFLPKTTENHDEYSLCIIKMLALNNMYGNNFDLLAFSNIMFFVEEYNKIYITNQIQAIRTD